MRANSVSVSYTSPRERGRLITPDGRPGTWRGLSMNQTLRESHVCRDNDRTNQSVLNIKLTSIPTASRLWFLADLRHKKCMYIGINYYIQTPTSGAKPCAAEPWDPQPRLHHPRAPPASGEDTADNRLSSRGAVKNRRKGIRITNHLTN